MFYNLNENTEKIVSIDGRSFFVPYTLPEEVRALVVKMDSMNLLEGWNHIARKLLTPMNDVIPKLTQQGVADLISIIDSY